MSLLLEQETLYSEVVEPMRAAGRLIAGGILLGLAG